MPLTARVFDTLLYLVEHSGAVLERDEMMDVLWPDAVVEENNLTQNISTLRRVLGETRGSNQFIATVPGRGYRFVAAVSRAKNGAAPEQEMLAQASSLPSTALAPGDSPLQALSSQVDVSPQWMLLVATGLGANDEAFIYLEEAFAKHSMGGAIPLKVNPIFDPLRSDPRYAGFLRRARFVP